MTAHTLRIILPAIEIPDKAKVELQGGAYTLCHSGQSTYLYGAPDPIPRLEIDRDTDLVWLVNERDLLNWLSRRVARHTAQAVEREFMDGRKTYFVPDPDGPVVEVRYPPDGVPMDLSEEGKIRLRLRGIP